MAVETSNIQSIRINQPGSGSQPAKDVFPKLSSNKIQTVEATLELHLPPFYLGNTMQGVRETLNNLLMKYCCEIDAVILAYSNVKILSTSSRILYDSPFSHFLVHCTMCIFRPKIGHPIVGVVNKVSPDHIGLLVFGVFNASIPSYQIRSPEFRWDQINSQWARSSEQVLIDNDNTSNEDIDNNNNNNDSNDSNDSDSDDEGLKIHKNNAANIVNRDDDDDIADSADQSQVVNVGSVLRFTLSKVRFIDNMLALVGSLKTDPVSTGLLAASSN